MKTVQSFIRKTKTLIKKPKLLFINALYFLSPIFADKLYLKLLFPLRVGYLLNLKNPKSYNEKLQWLKLYYRDPILSKLVDKYEYKEYVKNIIGEEYVVKNYGVWDSANDIDFDKLPAQFVLKTTHDQGGVVICTDKSKFDINIGVKKLNKHLKRKIFYLFREWPYKNVKPRVIAEEFLSDENEAGLKDYKFYCFHGEPKVMYISSGRQFGAICFDFYDMDFNKLDIKRPEYKQSDVLFKKPEGWDLMIEFARKLSEGQPHVRIDFYNINGKVLFGEYTLFQGGGLMPFYPQKWDYILGSWIDLSVCTSKDTNISPNI